ncbi:hypothetical protein PEL8287_00853 [Roseovarius litorisediminis]|uniref:DUF4139 domain-containing protein n=1 Tax=Roseovarius litorisediminis TaxID=1312363 RepID=A0A1Y5RM03_9RHOB|nr:mucoidy inhibitor MuiA family protein [Roseovarius litorisediminis]SLN20562.1 hypothetical protein PEL8287_00853 [Roseovarius litorisediminis]
MRTVTLPLILTLTPAALWAADIPLTSDVSQVTLYPQGATITRAVPFTIPVGQHDLILTDLPQSTPLASIRVAVDGASMGTITARNDFVPPRDDEINAAFDAAKTEVERLEQALRDGQANVQAIRLEIDAAEARVAFLRQIGEGDGVAKMDVTALRDLVGMIGDETLAARKTALDAQNRADAADRALKDTREALEKAHQVLAALVPEDKARAMLAVSVSSQTESKGTLTVTYNIAQAGWQPVYDLKLTRDTSALDIERGAFVYQATGENWQDVSLTLSTVRPSEQTTPGDIWPWLRRIEDPDQPRLQSKNRAAFDQMEMGAALDMAAEPAIVREEADAQFDGLAVTYNYPSPVSVASRADRVRLSLGTLTTKVDLQARAVPLMDQTAFLMASLTNDMGELILPSNEASFYIDGRYIGQQYLHLIPAGGEADLSFGPIDGLRLTRTVLDRNEGDRGIISKSNELTESVRIEVENLTGESWPINLLDRVPYSEQEDLEIAWQAQPRPTEQDVDGKRGVLAWEFTLPAGETQEITLDHDLEWPEGKVLR